MTDVLRITEIFHSLQGESSRVGLPTVFVRLTGCPLRCEYCDTAYAFTGGKRASIDDIVERVLAYHCPNVCITGGEPLAQPKVHLLIQRLCDSNLSLSIETSGALDIGNIDKRVSVIMDIKTPDSQEVSKNRLENIPLLKARDEMKFVLCSKDDYDWAKNFLKTQSIPQGVEILFSPSFHQLPARQLADWIIADKLPVRFQLQIHKILWNDTPGH